jgi:protein involved in polysaccharide export with SLBB domain
MKQALVNLLLLIAATTAFLEGIRAEDAVPAQPAPTQAVEAGTAANYLLSPNDLIYVKVFQEDDLNSTLRVAEDGTIIFPLIGSVKIGGQSVATATRSIHDLLDARFLVNPQVTLTVLGYANRHITVLGQVQKPGDYNLRDQGSVSLLQAVGMAGGFTRLANSANIIVKREVDGQEKILHLNGKTMASDNRSDPFVIVPGDTITVTERFF